MVFQLGAVCTAADAQGPGVIGTFVELLIQVLDHVVNVATQYILHWLGRFPRGEMFT